MSETASLPQSIGPHHRVERLLGSGGTSRVFEVTDQRSGRRLALKQSDDRMQLVGGRGTRDALFRQEFHVLSRIAHPNVVSVFEYGSWDGRPFYTMELLEGRSLSELAPLPWQRLCEIIIDLCSPLSLLHARRFVHCDVTARNVLVNESGLTKLIDFGALTGLDRQATTIAGTPPHMAPELVRKQSIDGRVDLFALGALAYSVLAGRHAYPARTIQELPQAWAVSPSSLLELGVEVPPALDELVMSLLALDASLRPLQAAELAERLARILGHEPRAGSAALNAQLATPRLVGREPVLEQFRQVQLAAARGEGGVLCITGAQGVGRSRMLEACALEAIHAGHLVLHIGAGHAGSEPYTLLAQLLSAAWVAEPGLAALLAPTLAAHLARAPADLSALARQLGELSQAERQRSWHALCGQRTAVVLIDDLTRADVQSIQVCLTSSAAELQLPLLLVASLGSGAAELDRDVVALVKRGRTVTLGALTEAETTQLVSSIFGDASELEALVAWVHRTAAGVPGACVELARHAVERGYVRYQAGQFWITDDFRTGRAALPRALDESVARRIWGLQAVPREALAALSLLTPFGVLSTSEQVELLCAGGWSQAEALDALDELLDAELISLVRDSYALRYEEVTRRAVTQLPDALLRAWQRRISSLYERRGRDFGMLSNLHLDLAGEHQLAYQRLIAFDATLRGPDDPNIKVGASRLGIALHERMLAYGLATSAPRCEILHLRRVLVSIGSTADPRLGREGPVLLEGLSDDVGLSFWNDADPAVSEHEKLIFCLTRAQERFATAPPGERLAPIDAIRLLAEAVGALSGMASSSFDVAASAQLVERFRPLRTLAPVLDITYRMLEATGHWLSHGGQAPERWGGLLQSLQTQPDGLSELIWRYMRSAMHFSVGMELALAGDAGALEHAEVLSQQQRMQTQACSLRLLYALAYGDHKTAAMERRQRAIAALASAHEDQQLTYSYLAEVVLLEACGDLLELQPLAAWFEVRAEQREGLRPVAAYARAACHVLSGQIGQAEQLIDAHLSLAPPLRHPLWFMLRGLRAEVALLRGEPDLARQLARDVLDTAAAASVDFRPDTRVQRTLALAHAQLGDVSSALGVLEPLLQGLQDAFTVRAGSLHETRARLALLADDRETFWLHYGRAQAVYGRFANPHLTARLQRLTSAAIQSQHARSLGTLSAQQKLTTIRTDLERLAGDEQCRYLLAMLLRDAEAHSGYLYGVRTHGPSRCLAVLDAEPTDAALDAQVTVYLERLMEADNDRTQSVMVDAEWAITRHSPDGRTERLAVIPLRGSEGTLRGLALLRTMPMASAEIRTEGLCTIAADVLAQLTASRRALA